MVALQLTVFVNVFGFGVIVPLLPFYGERFGAGPELIALLMSIYALMQLVAAPLWGALSDRIGRKPVIVISLVGAALSYAMIATAHDFWTIFLARGLAGSMGGNLSVANAYVADVTSGTARSRGMGKIGAAFGLGFVLGPAVGGLVAGKGSSADLQTPFWIAAALSSLALIIALAFLREPTQRSARLRARGLASVITVARLSGVQRLLGLTFITNVAFTVVDATVAMFMERQFGWGPSQTGLFLMGWGLLTVLLQGFALGRLETRFGELRLVGIACASLGIGCLTLSVSTSVWHLLVVLVTLSVGFGAATPTINGLLSKRAPAEDAGSVLGLAQSISALARVVGPAAAGVLFAQVGRRWPYGVCAALMTIAVPLLLGLTRNDVPSSNEAEVSDVTG